jgi:hypothetical protein
MGYSILITNFGSHYDIQHDDRLDLAGTLQRGQVADFFRALIVSVLRNLKRIIEAFNHKIQHVEAF